MRSSRFYLKSLIKILKGSLIRFSPNWLLAVFRPPIVSTCFRIEQIQKKTNITGQIAVPLFMWVMLPKFEDQLFMWVMLPKFDDRFIAHLPTSLWLGLKTFTIIDDYSILTVGSRLCSIFDTTVFLDPPSWILLYSRLSPPPHKLVLSHSLLSLIVEVCVKWVAFEILSES